MQVVLSLAVVMCASPPEKVEILAPPNGAVPGEPDKELNPKKKIWEQIQPDLHTNAECVATHKGAPFERSKKMATKTPSLMERNINTFIDTFHHYSRMEGNKDTLSQKEFKQMVKKDLANFMKKEKKKDELINDIMEDLDTNQDKQLSFEEYVMLVAKLVFASHEKMHENSCQNSHQTDGKLQVGKYNSIYLLKLCNQTYFTEHFSQVSNDDMEQDLLSSKIEDGRK
ncbi:hypothetical protein STEG23_029912 [Scotinomys teguina]